MEIEWPGRGTLTVDGQGDNRYVVRGIVCDVGKRISYEGPVPIKDQRGCRAFLHSCSDIRGYGRLRISFSDDPGFSGIDDFTAGVTIPGREDEPPITEILGNDQSLGAELLDEIP